MRTIIFWIFPIFKLWLRLYLQFTGDKNKNKSRVIKFTENVRNELKRMNIRPNYESGKIQNFATFASSLDEYYFRLFAKSCRINVYIVE